MNGCHWLMVRGVTASNVLKTAFLKAQVQLKNTHGHDLQEMLLYMFLMEILPCFCNWEISGLNEYKVRPLTDSIRNTSHNIIKHSLIHTEIY